MCSRGSLHVHCEVGVFISGKVPIDLVHQRRGRFVLRTSGAAGDQSSFCAPNEFVHQGGDLLYPVGQRFRATAAVKWVHTIIEVQISWPASIRWTSTDGSYTGPRLFCPKYSSLGEKPSGGRRDDVSQSSGDCDITGPRPRRRISRRFYSATTTAKIFVARITAKDVARIVKIVTVVIFSNKFC